jgi:hypothetical protein
MNRMQLVLALFVTTIMLSGCFPTYVVQPDRMVAASQPAPVAPVVSQPQVIQVSACPYGTALSYWHNPVRGHDEPICVSQNVVYVRDSGPGFGWGLVTGVGAALILRHAFHGGYYGRRW